MKPLANFAVLQEEENDISSALVLLETALERAKKIRDDPSTARCYFYLARILQAHPDRRKDEDQPRKLFHRSRDLFQKMGDRWSLCHVLLELGKMESEQNKLAEAREAVNEAIALARRLDSPLLMKEVQIAMTKIV